MIIDYRYHTASLVAVFLALGVGIAIGSMMVGEGLGDKLMTRQEQIVRRLEQDFIDLKNETRSAQEESLAWAKKAGEYQRLIEEYLPFFLQGRLSGQGVLLVEADDSCLSPSLVDYLKLAGAKVSAVSLSEAARLAETGWDVLSPADTVVILGGQKVAEAGLFGSNESSAIVERLKKKGLPILELEEGDPNNKLFDDLPAQMALILRIAEYRQTKDETAANQ